MSDTTRFEYVAEDLISHQLQLSGLLVAKPRNDRLGTDLLVFNEVDDGVKFCRVQCKGRSVLNSDARIEIPAQYVTNGFVLFVFVEREPGVGTLYCFLPNHIRAWRMSGEGEYVLHLGQRTHQSALADWQFGPDAIDAIKSTIRLAEANNEFKNLITGRLSVQLEGVMLNAQGCLGPASHGEEEPR